MNCAACKGWFESNGRGLQEEGKFPVLQRKEEGLDGLRGKTLESSASELNSSFLSIIF